MDNKNYLFLSLLLLVAVEESILYLLAGLQIIFFDLGYYALFLAAMGIMLSQ
jgi:hypothetical protein